MLRPVTIRSILFFLAMGVCGRGGGAQQPATPAGIDARQLYAQLNNVSVDPAHLYSLRDAQLTRDRAKIFFNRGYIGFFNGVAGEVTGAIFVGDGEVLMIPPNSIEKGSLAQFTGSAILEEEFGFAYLRFTDQTAAELKAAAHPIDPDDPEQPVGLVERWNPIIHKLNGAFSLRIMRDLLGERGFPYFVAQVHGLKSGPFAVVVDQRAPEAVAVGAVRTVQGTVFRDLWCSFPSRASQAAGGAADSDPVKVESYKIDTRIQSDNSLQGNATLEMQSLSGTERILPFLLSSRLEVSSVLDERGRKLDAFRGEVADEEGNPVGEGWIAVALPTPYPAGSKFRLEFTYKGNVITNVGNGVLYVGARSDWYPNGGLVQPAHYDLSFEYPARLTLVATGQRVEETQEGDSKRSRWISEVPFRVAGFNLGNYHSQSRRAGKTEIEVYATPEAEAELEKLHVATKPPEVERRVLPDGRVVAETFPKLVPRLEPSATLGKVADAAARAIRYYETLFGPYPYSRLAIAQVPGHFGQGWPELVYLPTLSFLPEPERVEMGFSGRIERLEERAMVAHEIAHQWWGNAVGWKTPHDQWLSEGFASYAALLYLSQEKNGRRMATELLQGYKRDLLGKIPQSENTVESGGPIWLGQRLSNSTNPDGYEDIVYKKACWVLHMLHILMTDPATGSDAQFFKMLSEFVNQYRDSNPSTEDFVRHVAKYVRPSLDLEHNHRLDWFFDSWVYGTGIPTYKVKGTIRTVSAREYIVQGNIQQSEVPADFQMAVPLIVTYSKDEKATLGFVPVSVEGGHFRFRTTRRPAHVLIDEDNLLAVTK